MLKTSNWTVIFKLLNNFCEFLYFSRNSIFDTYCLQYLHWTVRNTEDVGSIPGPLKMVVLLSLGPIPSGRPKNLRDVDKWSTKITRLYCEQLRRNRGTWEVIPLPIKTSNRGTYRLYCERGVNYNCKIIFFWKKKKKKKKIKQLRDVVLAFKCSGFQ